MKNEKILLLDARGCEFPKGKSDIGNYRVCTYGKIPCENRRAYFFEFTLWRSWIIRYNNKRTGAPLKHPKQEYTSDCAMYIDNEYDDGRLSFRDLELSKKQNDPHNPRPHTFAALLEAVNAIAVEKYTHAAVIPHKAWEMGGARERYAIEHGKPEGVFIRGHICARFVLPDCDEFQAANGATFDTVTESWIN